MAKFVVQKNDINGYKWGLILEGLEGYTVAMFVEVILFNSLPFVRPSLFADVACRLRIAVVPAH